MSAAFSVYVATCFHLEYGLDQEAFRVAVVARRASTSRTRRPGWRSTCHHKIDGFCNLRFGIGEGRLCVVAHDQIGEAMQCLLRRIRMNRRERSGMAGVEGIEQCSRLDSTHFAEMMRSGSIGERT